jgi:hypothetical protein
LLQQTTISQRKTILAFRDALETAQISIELSSLLQVQHATTKTPYQHLNPKSYPSKLLSNLKLQLQHPQNPNPHHPSLSSNTRFNLKKSVKGLQKWFSAQEDWASKHKHLVFRCEGWVNKQKPLRQSSVGINESQVL